MMCSLCWDGSPSSLPHKNITHYLPQHVLDEMGVGHDVSCGFLELAASHAFPETSSGCSQARALAGICGCPPIDNACSFCFVGDMDPDQADYVIESPQDYGLPPISCGDLQLTATQQLDGSKDCFDTNLQSYICGCNGGRVSYSPCSTTNRDDDLILWASRIAGILSILGSLYIITDIVLRQRKQQHKTITSRQEILVCMHFFDFFNSIAWVLGPTLTPETNDYGESRGVRGAHGTQGTCQFHGFMIQLGFTAAFYNAVLSTYYMLVVRYGWREEKIKRCMKWFHLVSVLGLGLALAGIPFYNYRMMCYIEGPPFVDSYLLLCIFTVVPLGLSIIIVNSTVFLMYDSVRSRDNTARQWRLTNSSVKQDVFWQCVWFLLAFDLTWPIFVVVTLTVSKTYYQTQYYWLFLVAFFLTPLQGFLNAFVYLRTEIKHKHHSEQSRKRSGENRSTSLSGTFLTRSISWMKSFDDEQQQQDQGRGGFHDGPTSNALWEPSEVFDPSDEGKREEAQANIPECAPLGNMIKGDAANEVGLQEECCDNGGDDCDDCEEDGESCADEQSGLGPWGGH